jgi:guanylate kinase
VSVGVILYGAPAAGKDTVDGELSSLGGYQHFTRIKVGPGRAAGYRMATPDDLVALRAAGEVIWENQAYGSTYVVDRGGLVDALAAGVPVVHLGQPEAVAAVLGALAGVRWLVVELLCSRDVAAARLKVRDPAEVEQRLAVWDTTPRLDAADLAIDTGAVGAQAAAQAIDRALSGGISVSLDTSCR